MPSVRIDAALHRTTLSASAAGLHALATSYAFDRGTDGYVPLGWALARGDLSLADELVAAGLWAFAEDGYEVLDFVKRNGTEASREAKRAAARARMSRVRANTCRTEGPKGDEAQEPSVQAKSRADVRANMDSEPPSAQNLKSDGVTNPENPVVEPDEPEMFARTGDSGAELVGLEADEAQKPHNQADSAQNVRANTITGPTSLSEVVGPQGDEGEEPSGRAKSPPDVRANGDHGRIKGVEVGVAVQNTSNDEGPSEVGGEPSTINAQESKAGTIGEIESERLCRMFAEYVAATTGTSELPPAWKSARWRDACRLLLDNGPPGYTKAPASPKQVEFVIGWLSRGATRDAAFWAQNIQSMPTLRQRWLRIVSVIRAEQNGPQGGAKGQRQQDRQQRRAEKLAAAQKGVA